MISVRAITHAIARLYSDHQYKDLHERYNATYIVPRYNAPIYNPKDVLVSHTNSLAREDWCAYGVVQGWESSNGRHDVCVLVGIKCRLEVGLCRDRRASWMCFLCSSRLRNALVESKCDAQRVDGMCSTEGDSHRGRARALSEGSYV